MGDPARQTDPTELSPPPTLDPVGAWIAAHLGELAQHRGKLLAVHGDRGLLAVGATYTEVTEALGALGLTREELDEVVVSPVMGTV